MVPSELSSTGVLFKHAALMSDSLDTAMSGDYFKPEGAELANGPTASACSAVLLAAE